MSGDRWTRIIRAVRRLSGNHKYSGGIQGNHEQDESIAQYDARYGDGERHDFENSTDASGTANLSRGDVQIHSTNK